MIGDLEPARDLPLEGAWFAPICRDRVGHQLKGEYLLLLAAEQRQYAVRRQFSQPLAELEIVGKLGTRFHLAYPNPRTQPAARPHFFAQGPDQRGVLAETLDEDRACAFESGGPIAYSLILFDVPASHLL